MVYSAAGRGEGLGGGGVARRHESRTSVMFWDISAETQITEEGGGEWDGREVQARAGSLCARLAGHRGGSLQG